MFFLIDKELKDKKDFTITLKDVVFETGRDTRNPEITFVPIKGEFNVKVFKPKGEREYKTLGFFIMNLVNNTEEQENDEKLDNNTVKNESNNTIGIDAENKTGENNAISDGKSERQDKKVIEASEFYLEYGDDIGIYTLNEDRTFSVSK